MEAGAVGTATRKKQQAKEKRGGGGGGGAGGGRLLDLNLARIQNCGKLATSFNFCQQSLLQALQKADEFGAQFPEIQQQFEELKARGICEDRVLDKSLNLDLGDRAGVIKCLYALNDRRELCRVALGLPVDGQAADECGEAAASEGTAAEQTGGTGAAEDEIRKCEMLQDRLTAALQRDSAMQTHAGNAIVVQYLKREDLFDSCTTRDAFRERLKEIQSRATETKTIAQALRRCITEITSMIKASTLRTIQGPLITKACATRLECSLFWP